MNIRLYIICVASVFALIAPVLANSTATVHGGVYAWDTFEPLENAVIEVNSTPAQSMLAKYGLYSFELGLGVYNITAKYYQNSTLVYSTEETIKIEEEGNYVHDLLLLPVYSQELMGNSENSSSEKKEANFSTISYLLVAFVLFFLLVGGYQLFTKHKKFDQNTEKRRKSEHILRKEPINSNLPELVKESEPLLKAPEKGIEPEVNHDHEVIDDTYPKKEERVSTTAPIIGKVTKLETSIPATKSRAESEPEISVTESIIESESKIQDKSVQIENQEKSPVQETEFLESERKEESQKISSEASTANSSEDSSSVPEVPSPKKRLPLPGDLQEIMDIIRGQGGRITQKNLRSRLKCSEGKVSLMLADLERRELIEKFKLGRGNIVIVKDEER
ncbi:MAG TPA: hypothetical protein VN278_04200 [Methanosarcina sp.]|nr:hypothetical protein [Methanosarcina sp.]